MNDNLPPGLRSTTMDGNQPSIRILKGSDQEEYDDDVDDDIDHDQVEETKEEVQNTRLDEKKVDLKVKKTN